MTRLYVDSCPASRTCLCSAAPRSAPSRSKAPSGARFRRRRWWVVCRNTVNAKHTGDFQGIAPTGESVSWGAITVCRVRDGQVVEMWVQADFLGLMQQVGAVETPAAVS